MSKAPRNRGHNIVSMPTGTAGSGSGGSDDCDHTVGRSLTIPGSSTDPVMADALRLMEAFLAIEDKAARSALIALAERLVSYDWVRRVQPR